MRIPFRHADKYLQSGFTKRLPQALRAAIRAHGLRNSHLLSIAPTGTISLPFADNASNGIEPAFSWTYECKKRLPVGSERCYRVEDHEYRLYRESGGDINNLPEAFVNALEITVIDHMRMLEAVQPFVDTSVSKTTDRLSIRGLCRSLPRGLGVLYQIRPTGIAAHGARAPLPPKRRQCQLWHLVDANAPIRIGLIQVLNLRCRRLFCTGEYAARDRVGPEGGQTLEARLPIGRNMGGQF